MPSARVKFLFQLEVPLRYNAAYVAAEISLHLFLQPVDIDGLLELNDDPCPADLGHVVFEYAGGIDDDHWDNRYAAFFRDLKAAIVEGEKGIVDFIARTFRKNAEGNSLFDFLRALEYGLQSFFYIVSVQKQAVYIFHP